MEETVAFKIWGNIFDIKVGLYQAYWNLKDESSVNSRLKMLGVYSSKNITLPVWALCPISKLS